MPIASINANQRRLNSASYDPVIAGSMVERPMVNNPALVERAPGEIERFMRGNPQRASTAKRTFLSRGNAVGSQAEAQHSAPGNSQSKTRGEGFRGFFGM